MAARNPLPMGLEIAFLKLAGACRIAHRVPQAPCFVSTAAIVLSLIVVLRTVRLVNLNPVAV